MGEMFLDDGDVRLYQGDVTDVLAGMPDESVDCVVTSPPYWGLRDYGTGLWDGGDPDCDHVEQYTDPTKRPASGGVGNTSAERSAELAEQQPNAGAGGRKLYRETCGKCGARRVDQQLGLEPTPDLYVERIVSVFREVRRVLAPHGTCWVNLGDSYAGGGGGNYAKESKSVKGRDGVHLTNIRNREDWLTSAGYKAKDLCGIPWRVAFALQQDGWWLRADIIWAKPNPMPESVTDRPTKAHEYVFLLTKAPRYYFDQEAVRERLADPLRQTDPYPTTPSRQPNGRQPNSLPPAIPGGYIRPAAGARNVRSVWQIATQPYPEAHFATYPEELVRRCVLAGCPERVCRVCGVPSERIVESEPAPIPQPYDGKHGTSGNPQSAGARIDANKRARRAEGYSHEQSFPAPRAIGWSECDCLLWEGVPSEASKVSHVDASNPVAPGAAPSQSKWRTGVVLDPFIGSGTTCKVARDHGRHSIGIDLSTDYLNLAARRLQQLSLLT